MKAFLPFLLGAAMFATLAVVVVGIISFAVHGKFYKRNSNKMMRMRVLFQAIAMVIFALLMAAISNQ